MDWNWNAISAVATVAATIAALGIASRTEYKARKVARKMAGLHAATYHPQLTDIVDIVGRINVSLKIQKIDIAICDNFPTLLPERWESAISVLDAEALSLLEPLPNNAAYRAAVAIGCLKAIGRELREFENAKVGWHQMNRNERMTHLTRIKDVIYYAHVTLRAALLDFEKGSLPHVKPLTPEEQGFVD
jgi:hypothetical protein